MTKKALALFLTALTGLLLVIACGPAATPQIVEVVKEVPVEIEVPVEVEKEVIREVQITVPRDVIKEVPVEVPVPVEVVKEVPIEKEVMVEVMVTPTSIWDNEPYVIGVMDSVTGPGESYGTVIVQAKQMAADEINAAGGINGRPLKLIVEDSKCGGQDAITAYKKLTEVDDVKIILGTSCSGAMLGAAPLAEADGVVLFSASATNPDIANAGDYIFRTAINDARLGVDAGNTLWVDGLRSLATISETTDYAEGIQRTSVTQFEQNGGSVVAEERFSSDVTDFRSQLTKLINANPDGILVVAQREFAGGTILKQLRELGYEGPIYTDVVPVSAEALNIAGEAATGVKAILPNPDLETDRGKEFLQDFRNKYGYITLNWFLGSGYDTVYIAAECLGHTEDDQDADGFRDCLYDLTYSGAIGDNYTFDEQGEVVGLTNVIGEVLPVNERTEINNGLHIIGQAPMP